MKVLGNTLTQLLRTLLAAVLVAGLFPTISLEVLQPEEAFAGEDAQFQMLADAPTASANATVSEGWTQTGTCEWQIDNEGCLTIRPLGNGESGTMGRPTETYATHYAWSWFQERNSIKKVKIEKGVSAGSSLEALCYGCKNLTTVDFSNLDTSNVTTMYDMFYECSSLVNLDLSNFDTSNVAGMSYMFYGCSSLVSLDLTGFDTSNMKRMDYMFYQCFSLSNLDLSSFNTSNVTGMSYMFYRCSSLASLDLSNFDTSNVTDMSRMFEGCSKLGSLNVSGFDTSNVTKMDSMFAGCNSLTSLDVSSFDTTNATYMAYMFSGCRGLASLKFGPNFMYSESGTALSVGIPTPSTTVSGARCNGTWGLGSEAANMRYTRSQLEELSKTKGALSGIWYAQTDRPEEVALGWSFDVEQETNGTHYIVLKEYIGSDTNVTAPAKASCNGTTYPVALSLSEGNNLSLGCIENLKFEDGVYVGSGQNLFSGNDTVKSIGCSNLDTSRVTNMAGMFWRCSSLNSLDVSNFDTSKVTSMSSMFLGCDNLASLDLSNFNTSKVTDMTQMFRNCSLLISLDLNNFDTSKVEGMWRMFSGCSSLKTLNTSSFNTSNVQTTQGIFAGCSSLTSLDISNWDTSKIQDFDEMFWGCSSLTSLDLSNLDMSAENAFGWWMFDGCSSLSSITLNDHFVFSRDTDGSWASPLPTPEGEEYTGLWISSADGKAYAPGEIPEGVAATYTAEKVGDVKTDLSSAYIQGLESGYAYRGEAVTPSVRVMLDSTTLTEGVDYTVSYAENTKPGSATLTISGIGNYFGSVSATFNIVCSHNWVEHARKAATCTTEGSVTYSCSYCQETKAEAVAALGHSWGEWKVVKTATNKSEGEEARACERCETMETRALDQLEPSVARIAGNKAENTAVEISKATFSDNACSTVIIANDRDFMDSMSATGLAGALNAPIILVGADGALYDDVKAEIGRVGAVKAYVIGGPNAVAASLDEALKGLGVVAERVYGNEAWDTSVACAKKIAEINGGYDYAIVARSDNFQDALSMSSFTYAYKVPIILAPSYAGSAASSLPEGGTEILNAAGKQVFVAGGTGAIAEAATQGVTKDIKRLWGENGFDTSNQIAIYMASEGLLSAETVCIASGASRPGGLDALAGAALAGKNGGVMLLANTRADFDDDGVTSTVAIDGVDSKGNQGFLLVNGEFVSNVYILGGTAVMPEGIEGQIKLAVGVS